MSFGTILCMSPCIVQLNYRHVNNVVLKSWFSDKWLIAFSYANLQQAPLTNFCEWTGSVCVKVNSEFAVGLPNDGIQLSVLLEGVGE